MSEVLDKAIYAVSHGQSAFCRYITGNDTGTTGSHQSGFYIPKCASSLLFDKPAVRGENMDKTVKIKWQDDFETESRFIYYGKGSRNEYRVTRFGREFRYLKDENVGDLLILVKNDEEDYSGYVLSSDEDIDGFLAYFNLSSEDTNQLINAEAIVNPNDKLAELLRAFIAKHQDFPTTVEMATAARDCYNEAFGTTKESIYKNSDDVLLDWVKTEFDLFKAMEDKVYTPMLKTPFESVNQFVEAANQLLNRRKSRAGKSLEHHLASIFTASDLIFEEQVVTEDNKKPDFIFPNGKCYKNFEFPAELLIALGAKTTCKDRWRQVISEADRIEEKHLFTLQQGISKNQLREMHDAKVTLVVPHKYISSFPKEYQSSLLDLHTFVEFVKEKQANTPKYYLVS